MSEFKGAYMTYFPRDIVINVDFIPNLFSLEAEEHILADIATLVRSPRSLKPRLLHLLEDVCLDQHNSHANGVHLLQTVVI